MKGKEFMERLDPRMHAKRLLGFPRHKVWHETATKAKGKGKEKLRMRKEEGKGICFGYEKGKSRGFKNGKALLCGQKWKK